MGCAGSTQADDAIASQLFKEDRKSAKDRRSQQSEYGEAAALKEMALQRAFLCGDIYHTCLTIQ